VDHLERKGGEEPVGKKNPSGAGRSKSTGGEGKREKCEEGWKKEGKDQGQSKVTSLLFERQKKKKKSNSVRDCVQLRRNGNGVRRGGGDPGGKKKREKKKKGKYLLGERN